MRDPVDESPHDGNLLQQLCTTGDFSSRGHPHLLGLEGCFAPLVGFSQTGRSNLCQRNPSEGQAAAFLKEEILQTAPSRCFFASLGFPLKCSLLLTIFLKNEETSESFMQAVSLLQKLRFSNAVFKREEGKTLH